VQHQVALAVEAQVLILRALLAHLVRALQVATAGSLEMNMLVVAVVAQVLLEVLALLLEQALEVLEVLVQTLIQLGQLQRQLAFLGTMLAEAVAQRGRLRVQQIRRVRAEQGVAEQGALKQVHVMEQAELLIQAAAAGALTLMAVMVVLAVLES
jgi:hypothetical protein